jgi:diguanylate cyclase (GGDEF)-like protein
VVPAPNVAPARASGIGTVLTRTVQRLLPATPGLRVWLFSVLLVIAAVVVYLLAVRQLPAVATPIDLPWPIFAVGFGLAELKVIEVHFRRESHAFSLSEFPAIIGLFFLSPNLYLVALFVGTGVALTVVSYQHPVKLAFNLANYLFIAVLSIVVFRLIGAPDGVPTLREYLAAFLAAGVAGVISTFNIASAITLSAGAPQFKKLPEMIQFGVLVAVANTSLALLAVTILWIAPSSVWLLAIPAVTLFLAYGAYVSEREKHERLELMYQSSRILQHSPELDVALLALLDHARAMFRAELAEAVLLPTSDVDHPLRTTSMHDGQSEVITPLDRVHAEPILEAILRGRQAGFASLSRTPGGREVTIRQAMVAPLVGESGVIGMLTIANRLTEGTAFSEDDLRLLETLANQAAIALENGQLEQSLAELSRLKEQLRYQAYHDPLTDLPNRALFVEQVGARLARQDMDGRRPVVILFDLDDFKTVNDTLGHAAGDELLVLVAERIRGCVRETDLAARLGGDEFAVLLDDDPSLADSAKFAKRLIDELSTTFLIHNQDAVVGVSVGIAMRRADDQTADELLRNADVAMYTAKSEGKRRFAVFDPSVHAAIIARHELSSELTRALGRGELVVHHQPIVALTTGQTVGVEALVRWRHPVRGLVRPDEFIGLAEESGAIVQLGRHVMAEAAREVVEWNRQTDGRRLYLSVNVSVVQLQQPDFLEAVNEAIAESGLEPSQLVLEITETAMFRDTRETIRKLEWLRELGVRIAIDDFGTGYSSLTYLRRFPADILKIAKEFVGPPDHHSEEWVFTASMITLGKMLGLVTIAEGIEQPGQLARLRDLGCEYGQGYLFAIPVPIGELAAALRSSVRSPRLGEQGPVDDAPGLPVGSVPASADR